MSQWDWLPAAWIYEEIFDDDSNDKSRDDTSTMIRHTTTMIVRMIFSILLIKILLSHSC